MEKLFTISDGKEFGKTYHTNNYIIYFTKSEKDKVYIYNIKQKTHVVVDIPITKTNSSDQHSTNIIINNSRVDNAKICFNISISPDEKYVVLYGYKIYVIDLTDFQIKRVTKIANYDDGSGCMLNYSSIVWSNNIIYIMIYDDFHHGCNYYKINVVTGKYTENDNGQGCTSSFYKYDNKIYIIDPFEIGFRIIDTDTGIDVTYGMFGENNENIEFNYGMYYKRNDGLHKVNISNPNSISINLMPVCVNNKQMPVQKKSQNLYKNICEGDTVNCYLLKTRSNNMYKCIYVDGNNKLSLTINYNDCDSRQSNIIYNNKTLCIWEHGTLYYVDINGELTNITNILNHMTMPLELNNIVKTYM